MASRWLILADDLTGAADCAIAFAKQGIASAVGWGDPAEAAAEPRPAVFSYDADSRGLTASQAAEKQRAALGTLLDADCILFKKIDSTLRGQPAAETVAAMEALRARSGSAFGIFAPAFPATGRTTEQGRILVAGKPLEEAEVWRRDHSYPNADLGAVLASVGIAAEKVPLSTIRSGADALRAIFADLAARGDIVAICDAQSEDDLARIAEASLPAEPSVFFIGSAGLAHALAAEVPGELPAPIALPAASGGALIVVGSLAAASRAAARELAAMPGVRHVPVEPALLLDTAAEAGRAALARSVTDGLDAGDDVLVEIVMGKEPDLGIGPQLAEALAGTLASAVHHTSGLAATGGETAAALLARFGVNGIRLADEIEPGVSLGVTLGGVSLPVVTKAGAFGDRGSLTRITERLRSIRQKGVLA
jgi:uncharacterized protein YgbK (DUF1537 family)